MMDTFSLPSNPIGKRESKTSGIEFRQNHWATDASEKVENKLNNIWNEIKNEKLGIDEDKKNILKNSTVSVRSVNVNDENANS